MRAILLQSAKTALAVALVYAVLIALALVIYPRPSASSAIDTGLASSTVFETQAKYLVFNRASLKQPGKRVIFLGASNTAAGFPARMVQSHTPGAFVHNLSINGSNITQIRQVFDMARMTIPASERPRTVYVFGLWYGLFVDDAVKWPGAGGRPGDTEIDTERYRYGFYRRTPVGAAEVVPDDQMTLADAAIYPLIVFEKSIRVLTEPVRGRFLGAQPNRTDAERNAHSVTPAEKREKIDFWNASFAGTRVSQQQFAVLNTMLDTARADGSRVVLLDLPIPAWHAAAVPYDMQYMPVMKAFIAQHRGDPNFSYVDMRDMHDDGWFSDEVHPKPRIRPQWIERVSGTINAAVAWLANGGGRSWPVQH